MNKSKDNISTKEIENQPKTSDILQEDKPLPKISSKPNIRPLKKAISPGSLYIFKKKY